MATSPSSVGSAIIDAAKNQMRQEVTRFLQCTDEMTAAQRTMARCRDEAAAARERYEQCERFLDDNVPGWREQMDPSTQSHYKLYRDASGNAA